MPTTLKFRDPNTIFDSGAPAGTVEIANETAGSVHLSGEVASEAMQTLGLEQVVLLDSVRRFVACVDIGPGGRWAAEVSPNSLGKDKAAIGLQAFAVSGRNHYGYPLTVRSEAHETYKAFAARQLPPDSPAVPTLHNALRELVLGAVRQPYTARSIKNAISTGNNYQSLELTGGAHRGGRTTRENFLERIDFAGRTVIDIGANTGENSRIARRLGASLVDGYEYDPFFVEIGRAVNALTGMTRVSLFQGDATNPALFAGLKFDLALALSVWVYLDRTMAELTQTADLVVFETHTLDHGMWFYYRNLLPWYPHAIALGYTDKPTDPHKSRMCVVLGKDKAKVEALIKGREFLKVEPYFRNRFLEQVGPRSKEGVLELARRCFEKHRGESDYPDEAFRFATQEYFEVFLAGLHQFRMTGEPGRLEDGNLYLAFLAEGIRRGRIDPALQELAENPAWLKRKVANKYEDAALILDGRLDLVAPAEIVPAPEGSLSFRTTEDEEIRCEAFDGHHRYFLCQLTGADRFHFVRKTRKG